MATERGRGESGAGSPQPGDSWNEHYRGTKYHFNAKKEFWWSVPGSNHRLLATGGHQEILDELLKLRPDGGTCRVTETSAVIVRKLVPGDIGDPIYVTEFGGPITFIHVDVTGDGLEPGDLWPGFYDGAKYSFQGKKVWWNSSEEGAKRLTVEALPSNLLATLLRFKPDGGSFRITENGVVLTLIPPQPLPPRLKAQYEALSNAQKQLVAVKVQSTQLLPVYIGRYYDGFTLQELRRLTDPLPPAEEAELASFLKRYHGQSDAVSSGETELPEFPDDRPEEVE